MATRDCPHLRQGEVTVSKPWKRGPPKRSPNGWCTPATGTYNEPTMGPSLVTQLPALDDSYWRID